MFELVYKQHTRLLDKVGVATTDEEFSAMKAEVEEFVCRMYDASGGDKDVGAVRNKVYAQKPDTGKQDIQVAMPPTPGALDPNTLRVHRQAHVWMNATDPNVPVLPPTEFGWKWDSNLGRLVAVTSAEAPLPEATTALISCGCGAKSGAAGQKCTRASCKCRQNDLPCTSMCKGCRGVECCANPLTKCDDDVNAWGHGHLWVTSEVNTDEIRILKIRKQRWPTDKVEVCRDSNGAPRWARADDQLTGADVQPPPFFWKTASGQLSEILPDDVLCLLWGDVTEVTGVVTGWKVDTELDRSVFRVEYRAAGITEVVTEVIEGEDKMRDMLMSTNG